MRPVNPDGQPWDGETSNLALQDIRTKAIAALNTRDEQRSQGRLNEENRYSPYREEMREDGKGSTFVIDPVLASLKHTGDELIQLTGARWAAFCATPQDEKPYVDKLVKATRVNKLTEMQAAGQKVEDSLQVGLEPTVPLMKAPVSRKKEPALIG